MLSTLVHLMHASWQALFYGLAVLVLLLAAFKNLVPNVKVKIDLVALGIALFVFVAFWQALALS